MTNVVEHQWSRNDASEFSEDTIISRLELQVAASPDNLAIVTDDISLTYRALDLRANSIAAKLALLPSPRDRPIVLFTKDEAARIAAMLGALKANRIFVAVAPDSPEKWIAQVIEDSGAAQIIVDDSTRSIAPSNIAVMEVEQLAKPSGPFVADRSASPNDTAYIVYTSGSTGRPKGVANSHRRLVHASDIRSRVARVGRGDRYANLRSSGVSSWIRNSLSPLFSGACLFPFDLHRHGLQQLAPWLIAQKITYVSLSSPLLRTWLALLPDYVRFPALRFVGTTDERLYGEDVIGISRHLEGDWCIGHSYASAECGTVTAQIFTPSRLPDAGIVAVGRPVDGMEVCIKNEAGELVPPREIGEIVVRSRFLAQGYWNNPDLTAKVFQTDPLDSATRIYRTGDLGRWRSDGMLEHVGRKGRRIRLRGYNIEPFEVECELMRQPGVMDAAVVLYDGAAGQEPCLVGYVVAPRNASMSDIRKGLAERLPSYMVPSHIVVLDSFPVASSGKIDHDALPPPYREKARLVAFRAPSDDLERELLAIWQEVLKIPQIGIDDDFFELGGSSLQTLTVFLEIEARLGRSLSPTAMVQAPTIARLSELIRTTADIDAAQPPVPLRASGTGLPLFLTHDSAGLLVFYRHLVSNLKSDRPVFGLQPAPLGGKHRIARTIEAMAANCVAEIRRVQPRGPYFIAGYSFAGRVSFEIAQQLIRAGERVSFLGLIDTSSRELTIEGRPWVSEAFHLSRKIRESSGLRDLLFGGLRFISRGPSFLRQEVLFRLLDLRIRQGRSIPYYYHPAYYERVSVRATRIYVPKPYPGHITMFSSAGKSERQRAHWERLALGGLTVLEVPAGHNDMFLPPHSKLLAEHFDACLAAAVSAEELVLGE